MNRSDSERIAAVLENIGYKKTSKIEEANFAVINMCSVRQSAVDRVFGVIQKIKNLKDKNCKIKSALTGCILCKKDFAKFKKHFDYILPIKTLALWKKYFLKKEYFYCPNQRSSEFNKKFGADYLKLESRYSNKFSALVPISTGCDNFCAYCVVPHTRGPELSRPTKDILDEIKNLIKKDYKEIWLIGQNVNSYNIKQKQKIDFAELLKTINSIKGNFWLRFTSPHPKDLSDKLIKTIAKCKKITPYLNLPAQSGNNEILKKMARPYKREDYKKLVEKIHKAFNKYRTGVEKNVSLSTDIIVGFPGETKKQFESTAKLFREIQFDMAYISQYSPRPEITNDKIKEAISKKERTRREQILTEILKKGALENNKRFIGKEIEILISKRKNNFLIGKSRHYKTVKVELPNTKSQPLIDKFIGKFIKVRIKKTYPFGSEGKIV